jgi:hypothetical protein
VRLYTWRRTGLADEVGSDAIPDAAGGEGGHGAAKPEGVIHRYVFNQINIRLFSSIILHRCPRRQQKRTGLGRIKLSADHSFENAIYLFCPPVSKTFNQVTRWCLAGLMSRRWVFLGTIGIGVARQGI